MPNLSINSVLHCFLNAAGQTIIIFRLPIAQYWQMTKPASIVFPKPTSSAKTIPLDSGDLNAKRAASDVD